MASASMNQAYCKRRACPNCGAESAYFAVSGDSGTHEEMYHSDRDPRRVEVRRDCVNCGHWWVEVYRLMGIEEG